MKEQVQKEQAQQINPEMLVLAREYRGLTQKQLAEAANIKQPQIAMIEGGVEQSASIDTFESIAKVLNFPITFFMTDETRLGFGSSSVYYRKKAGISAAERRMISSITNLNRIGLKRLLDAVDIEVSLQLPKFDIEEIRYAAQAASMIRAAWHLPDGPIMNLTQLMERSGIVIIECDFGTKSIDATSMRLSGLPPMVFVNKHLPPDRYRFTLAHELGHLVMHDVPKETMEDEADAFASELLMQEIEFKAATAIFGSKPSLRQLVQIKPYWKVAVSAMIMRMSQTGQISESTKRSLFVLMSNYKMRMNEPQPFPKEVPSLHRKIVHAAIVDAGMDVQIGASVINFPEDVFKQLYGVFFEKSSSMLSRHLRLV